MNRRNWSALILFLVVAAACCEARAATTILSNQGTGQDGLVYSFDSVPFPVSNTFPFIAAGKTTTDHDTEALVRFDLSALGSLTSAQVASATLELFVISGDSGFGGISTSPSNAVQADLFPLLGAWNRNTVTYNSKPANGALIDSQLVDFVGAWVTFDVTNTLKGWLDTPASNFGLILKGNAPVGSSPNWVYANFASGFAPNATNAPRLVVSAVPEPATLALALGGLQAACWVWLRRPKRRATHNTRLA